MFVLLYFILYCFSQLVDSYPNSSYNLQTTTTTSTLPTGTITGNRSNIFNPSNLHSISCQSTKGALCSRSRRSGLVSPSSANLDVKGGDTQIFAFGSHVLGGKHGSVGGGFVAIGLDFHAAGDADEGFTAGEVGDVDEGVVEGGEEVGYGEDFFALDEVIGTNFTVEEMEREGIIFGEYISI